MLSGLQMYIGSILVVQVLVAVVAMSVRQRILDKKAGRHICGGSCGSCGGGCGGCPMQGRCHGK